MSRIATSLDVLRAEVNKACPNRDKSSDGWVGNLEHQSRPSRHNPNNAGVVCALDITNDPAHGCDIHAIARALVARADKPEDLEYVISNRMSASRGGGWLWKPYSGVNPHEKHAHFAVGRGPDSEPTPPYDGTSSWHIAEIIGQEDNDAMTDAQYEGLVAEVRAVAKIAAVNNKLISEIHPDADAARIAAEKAVDVADEIKAAIAKLEAGDGASAQELLDGLAKRLES
jgi:hypothetical protein